MTTSTRHTNEAPAAWIDAYSWADECDRREAERGKPVPVITMTVLLAIALSAFILGLALVPGGL